MIYLDNAASTKIDDKVMQDMLPWLKDNYSNPGSIHAEGEKARNAIEKARARIAKVIKRNSEEIIFTSGATEANNLIINAFEEHIITSQIEHLSIINPCKEQKDVTFLPVTKSGIVDISKLEFRNNTKLISLMHVNNETGIIQPVDEIINLAKSKKVFVHVDSVQSFGKVPLPKADFLSISGHKIHGPKGIGILVLGKKIKPLFFGGGQERGIRSGTENVAGIVGLAKAVELSFENEKVEKLSQLLKKKILKINGTELVGNGSRVANIFNINFKGIEAESLVLSLSEKGIMVGMGSACSSKKQSHVLSAMGIRDKGCVRFSLSRMNTLEEIDKVSTVLPGIVRGLRK